MHEFFQDFENFLSRRPLPTIYFDNVAETDFENYLSGRPLLTIYFDNVREDSQIDFSTHNVKWTLWGWGVLGVDVIDLKSIFSRRLVIVKPPISIKNGTNIFLLT